MLTVARLETPEEAHLLRNYLEAEGITAFLFDEFTIQVAWYLSNAIGGVRIVVQEGDCGDALSAIGRYNKTLRSGSSPITEIRAWPIAAILSVLFGVPFLLFGRRIVAEEYQ